MDLDNLYELVNVEAIYSPNSKISKIIDARVVPIEEVYISTFKHGEKRGWKQHSLQEGRMFCIKGEVAFYIKRKLEETAIKVILKEEEDKMLVIKPQTIYAFEGLDAYNSILNCASRYNAKGESKNFDFNTFNF